MNAYTGIYSYYCAPLLTREAKSICTQEPCMSAFWHKNIPCKPVRFPQAIEPFWGDIVVGVECIFCWYWLADVCEEEGIDFVLGHALYMKSIHGVKTKNDRIDSLKIARLIRGGNFQYNLDTMEIWSNFPKPQWICAAPSPGLAITGWRCYRRACCLIVRYKGTHPECFREAVGTGT